MGATVSTGKSVSAFARDDGTIIYVLFEETYEKNCYPRTPSWSTVFVGTAEEAVGRIFKYGAVCSGGLLQSRGGSILPESYIGQWLKEMAAPTLMVDVRTKLEVRDAFYSPIPKESAEAAFAELRRIGQGSLADKLTAGESQDVSLFESPEIFLALKRSGIAAWRLIDSCCRGSAPAPGLGYSPDACKGVPGMEMLDGYRLGEHVLLRESDGLYRAQGWAYSVEADFVSAYAEREIKYPGSYKRAIKAYRAQIAALEELPSIAILHSNVTDDIPAWQVRSAKEVLEAIGDQPRTLKEIREVQAQQESNLIYKITDFAEQCFAWEAAPNPAPHQASML